MDGVSDTTITKRVSIGTPKASEQNSAAVDQEPSTDVEDLSPIRPGRPRAITRTMAIARIDKVDEATKKRRREKKKAIEGSSPVQFVEVGRQKSATWKQYNVSNSSIVFKTN